jgi:beta-lactamase superfamily II metal-dependent hydrolase
MGYEVDFLPVGAGECSGDAIALRFGNLNGARNEQRVIVIDGGYQETGEKLVEHVKKYYLTDEVDLLISTHPDNDHSSGLAVVLEELKVGTLAMHKPWEHTEDIAKMFVSGHVTDASVSEALRKSLDSVRDLEKLATKKGIPIVEPFTGASAWNGAVTIVGPTAQYYESLLPGFRCTPVAKDALLDAIQKALSKMKEGIAAIAESWNIETLGDDGVTSAENNSSAIALVRPEAGHALLFTADAGIPALTFAADALDASGFDYNEIKLIQVPHHGSRRNVGPTILNRLIGPKKASDISLRAAYVSAAKDAAPKHPAKKVTNAFRRRGAYVYSMADGNSKCHRHNAPDRGWGNAEALPLYSQVEDPDAEAA